MRSWIQTGLIALVVFAAACSDDGPTGPGDEPAIAASYINPDIGAATENPDVNPNSECETPDQADTQVLSDAGMTNRNVHNDACLFSDGGTERVDAPATFESSGVGAISACPDPDGAGPKTATLTDTNGDGRNDRCSLSGYQETGMAGDEEFHARVNNSTTAGTQTVVFCFDSDQNGCADETITDTITVTWTAPTGPVTAASYINPDTGAATENPDVDPNSECETPDQTDTQALSDAGMTNRNVHNDACLFGFGGTERVDAPATFESSGVGAISACPDPDGAGPKTATLTDVNGDGRNDRCSLSGYQETGLAGDEEFHARVNNSTTAGTQTVVFCFDSDQNGCADETITDTILVTWQ